MKISSLLLGVTIAFVASYPPAAMAQLRPDGVCMITPVHGPPFAAPRWSVPHWIAHGFEGTVCQGPDYAGKIELHFALQGGHVQGTWDVTFDSNPGVVYGGIASDFIGMTSGDTTFLMTANDGCQMKVRTASDNSKPRGIGWYMLVMTESNCTGELGTSDKEFYFSGYWIGGEKP